MDGARFDALARSFGRGLSRRRLVQGLTGGLAAVGIGLVGRQSGEAFICRQDGVLCAKDAQCCSGSCDPSTHRCLAANVCSVDFVCDAEPQQCGDGTDESQFCVCVATIEGGFTCVNAYAGCTPDCTSSAECADTYGPGWSCVSHGCCEEASHVCVPACGIDGELPLRSSGGATFMTPA